MKQKLLLTILFFSICTGVFAQNTPIINVYAYSQAVLQGAKPSGTIEEGGKEIKTVAEKKLNYFFYAEQKKSTVINIVSIWIKGKNYSAAANLVSKTPVEMKTDDPSGNTVLVPKSTNKIILITPGSEKITTQKPSASLSKSLSSSELIIIYKWKGKTYYSEVKKIKELKTLAAV